VTRERAMERGKIWRHFDFWLMGAVTLLIIFGIAMIRSTTLTSIDTSLQQLTSRQILYTVIGAVLFFVVIAIDYRLWGALANTIYVALVGLLLLVEALAVTTFGAARWLDLGIIQFQPSELGKFLIVLTLANLVANRAEEISRLNFVLQTLIHVGVPVVLVFLQPDLSTAIIYGVVWFAIMWAAGLRWQHIAMFGTIMAIVLPLAFITIVETPSLSYMARRIIVFIFPDPTSPAYQDAAYNINQALISIGSGGWFGQGYGHGSQVQLRFLKVRHTDFIFSAISNEFGFVGALIVILLLAFIVYRIFRAGRLARDTFGSYVCYGIGAIILYQSFFNIGMNMKLLPVAGLPLPFVSYGGSSLWTFLFGIGLVESVILRQKQIEF
jgi:rod shape determining protein RodA